MGLFRISREIAIQNLWPQWAKCKCPPTKERRSLYRRKGSWEGWSRRVPGLSCQERSLFFFLLCLFMIPGCEGASPVWLTSPRIIPYRSIHVVAHGKSSFFLWLIFHYIYIYICPTSSLSFHLSVDNHSISRSCHIPWHLVICKASNGKISLTSNLSLAPNLWLPLCSIYAPILFKGFVWLGLAHQDNLTFLKSTVLHNTI